MPETAQGALRRILPYVGLVAFGFAVALGLLVVLEVGLRILGIEGRAHSDPFAGFSRVVRMFQPATRDGVAWLVLSPGRAIAATGRADAGPQRQFLAEKKPGTFRIFTVGDSSAAGVPYGTGYAFTYWLEQRLRSALPEREFEVINAAMPGYATRRLVTVVEEIVRYDPDLVLIYNGHNEFAERRYYQHLLDMDPRVFRLREVLAQSRLWNTVAGLMAGASPQTQGTPRFDMENLNESAEMFAVLDGRAGGTGYPSARERQYGEMLYRRNMETMVRTIRAAGVAVMLMTQSQNFASWAPGASAHRADLQPVDHEEWLRMVKAGDARVQAGDCAGALERYGAALAIDDQYAELHFRVGRCEEQLGRFDTARAGYRRASDLDQVPHGAPIRFNEIVAELARDFDVPLADADAELTRAAPHGLVGDNLFADWVHPNIAAHQIIAAGIAREMERAGLPPKAGAWRDGYRDPDPLQLIAEKPSLRIVEHMARFSTCVLAHRTSCALPEIEALIALEPDNPGWVQNRTDMLKRAQGWPRPEI